MDDEHVGHTIDFVAQLFFLAVVFFTADFFAFLRMRTPFVHP
jgi:hypothetical protein